MKSSRQMIERLEGLLGSKDLSEWEQGFLESMKERKDKGGLSERQLDCLERLYDKHYGDRLK